MDTRAWQFKGVRGEVGHVLTSLKITFHPRDVTYVLLIRSTPPDGGREQWHSEKLRAARGLWFFGATVRARHEPFPASAVSQDSYLVDPASSHMLVSKIKPCMSKYKMLIR